MTTNDTIEALEARCNELEEYAWHTANCWYSSADKSGCTCGYDELMQSPPSDLSKIKAVAKWAILAYEDRRPCGDSHYHRDRAIEALSPEQRESILKGGE